MISKMILDTLEDAKYYKWQVLSAILKELGLPHSFFWIYQSEKKGYIKSTRHPTSHARLYSGKGIRELVAKIRQEINGKT